jgi:hypothetical protein
MSNPRHRDLNDLLDCFAAAAQDTDQVSIRDVLSELGDRSITPVILVVSVILISPISGIPGVPSISAFLIILLSVQALAGRRHLWLPDILLRRKVSGKRLSSMVNWLRKPSRLVDRHTHPRLAVFTQGPMRFITLAACVIIPMGWPFLEVLPLVSSTGALTVALLVFGLFTRDGLYVLAGYGMITLTLGIASYFLL